MNRFNRNDVDFEGDLETQGNGKKKFNFNFKEMDKHTLQKILIGGLAITITAGTYQGIIIPRVKENTRVATIRAVDVNAMPKVTVAMLKPEAAKIEKYTLLSEDLINNSFNFVEVPVDFVVDDPAIDLQSMVGRVTTSDILPSGQVSLSTLTDQTDWFGEFDRLKEYKISNTVADRVTVGNIVDVVVTYDTGDYDVVASKKKITTIKPIGGMGAVQTNPDGTQTQTLSGENDMVFSVDEVEYARLELAKTVGRLEVRLYIDESQQPSEITFNPAKLSQIKQKIKTEKNGN